nr:DUF3263 domain-containing protein [Rhodococcus oxybenzonivorans]
MHLPSRRRYDAEEQAMLELARIWAPYGGARPGDILVEFGMSPATFYARVTRILRTIAIRNRPLAERHLILENAARYSIQPAPVYE